MKYTIEKEGGYGKSGIEGGDKGTRVSLRVNRCEHTIGSLKLDFVTFLGWVTLEVCNVRRGGFRVTVNG